MEMPDTLLPESSVPLLAGFAAAGLIDAAGVHLAETLARLGSEPDELVLLAVALCLRAQQSGSVCLPLADLPSPDELAAATGQPDDPGVPDRPASLDWRATLLASRLVTAGEQAPSNRRPLRLVDDRLYLERDWLAEEAVRCKLLARIAEPAPAIDPDGLATAIARAFGSAATAADQPQRTAVTTALSCWTSVIAGGPGTGKTTTIARLLQVLDDLVDRPTMVALAAFTGKAANRMQESLAASLTGRPDQPETWRWLRCPPAGTLHALLGARPGSGFSRNELNPLPHDVVIVDEMSMVSLDLMAALLAALRPTTRLILVGDPDQLSSVDAGAVLADIVTAGLPMQTGSTRSAVTLLHQAHRFSGPIGRLAAAIRAADEQRAVELLLGGHADLEFAELDPRPGDWTGLAGLVDDLVGQGAALQAAGLTGDPVAGLTGLAAHRLLCAHRRGRYGVTGWSAAIEQLLGQRVPGHAHSPGGWYPGRPVLITRNIPGLQLSNGDTGVVLRRDGELVVALGSIPAPQLYSCWQLDAVETMHALTVHKSQGSEYEAITLILPDADSPLLTRELVYTALTRARRRVRIVGVRAAFEQAIRTPARRATGLGERLGASVPAVTGSLGAG